MQRIEKYGVIALVFLLVTILAVSLWSQKKGKNPFKFFEKKSETEEIAKREPAPNPVFEQRDVPLNPDAPGTIQTPQNSYPGSVFDPKPSPADPVAQTQIEVPRENDVFVTGTPGAPPEEQLLRHANPPAAEQKQSPAPAAGRTYVVKSGETLGEIASRELGSFARWNEIARLNGNLDAKKVRAGMKLVLPADAKAPVAAPKSAAKVNGSGEALPGGSYVVRSGDTLSGIAAKVLGNEGRWPEIAVLNPGVDPKRLKVGTRLRVPGGTEPRGTAASQPQNLLAKAGNGKGRVR